MISLNFIKDKYLCIVGVISILILFLTGVISYLSVDSINSPLIIHFNIYKGVDFLGNWFDILGILIVALVMISINFFLSDFLYNRERFLSYIFGFTSLLISILILIIISVIININ
ncbi:hypothetical protein JW698_03310 [Candidatus Wolfebacteria bacterium]|nr:hypothetical protein [Candidatus Wolfebacteria bacterium]